MKSCVSLPSLNLASPVLDIRYRKGECAFQQILGVVNSGTAGEMKVTGEKMIDQDWNTEHFEGDKDFVADVEGECYMLFSCSKYISETMNISHVVSALLKGDAS